MARLKVYFVRNGFVDAILFIIPLPLKSSLSLLGNFIYMLTINVTIHDVVKVSYFSQSIILRKKCPYSELFWFVFSSILSEYGEMRSISPYSVQTRENKDHNNSEYGHFLRSVVHGEFINSLSLLESGFNLFYSRCILGRIHTDR